MIHGSTRPLRWTTKLAAKDHKMTRCHRQPRSNAFSLVELVLVVAIIGVLAAIAAPRFSNVAQDSSRHALAASLTNVRKAIDAYYAEHGAYPGYAAGTSTPDNSAFVNQLMMYSNAEGDPSATYGYPYIYGPYLRPPFPVNPVNDLDTVHVKASPSDADPAAGASGWVAVLSHGYFGMNVTTAVVVDIGLGNVKAIKGGATIN